MPTQRICSTAECGATKGLRTVMVFDATDSGVRITFSKQLYCTACLEKLNLICHEHNGATRLCLLDVFHDGGEEEEENESAEQEITSLGACPYCVRDSVKGMPIKERKHLALLIEKLGYLDIISLHTAFDTRTRMLTKMKPTDRVVFGLTLTAHFYGLTPEALLFQLFEEGSPERIRSQ